MTTQTLIPDPAAAAHVEVAAAPPTVPTLVQHFWHHVDVRPDRAAMHAYHDGVWSTITWAEFGDAVRQVAAYLVFEGLAPGSHAAIWSENRPEWHIADMATLSAGLCPAPVYHSLSEAEGAYVLRHSESAVVFADSMRIVDRILGVRAELPDLRRIVVFDAATDVSDDGLVISWDEALARGVRAQSDGAAAEVERRIAAVAPDDLATLVYTSGTTGPPKAVMITHRNVDAAMHLLTSVIPVSVDDRVISYLPLAHVAERLSSEFRQYIFGNAVHFAASIGMLPAHLRDVRPTVFVGVPRVWEKMQARVRETVDSQPLPRRALVHWAIAEGRRALARRESGGEPGALSRWRLRVADGVVLRRIREEMGLDQATVMITAAAPISPDVLRFLHAIGLDVSELYGMSEDCGVTSVNPMGRARIGTVGPPLPGVDVSIATDGEILVRCGAVFIGYYKDDAATREVLVDGWLHTGDVGEFDAAGYLRITDRKKDLIITAGGKNISPTNIEVALKASPLISNAVAIGDQRPYVTALLTLDAEQASAFAHQHELDGTLAELAEHPLIRAAIQEHVDAVNANLAQVEQVKRWQLLADDFTVGEELTPTFKVRRKVVATRHAGLIEANYS